MDKLEQIKEVLQKLYDSELFEIWNNYCDKINNPDLVVFNNDLNELLGDETPEKIAQMICYGDYGYTDEYIKFDGYGNLKTSSYLEDLIYIDDLADYINKNNESFDNDELAEILDNDSESEE